MTLARSILTLVANASSKFPGRRLDGTAVLAATCAILTAISAAHAQITEDTPGLQATKNLVVMINGSLGQGAGIVFAADDGYAYIVTMFHVVRQHDEGGRDDHLATGLTLRFYERQRTTVQAEHWDDASYTNDLAVIRAPANGLSFQWNRLGDPQTLKKGDLALRHRPTRRRTMGRYLPIRLHQRCGVPVAQASVGLCGKWPLRRRAHRPAGAHHRHCESDWRLHATGVAH
jgi:hypothetical protein